MLSNSSGKRFPPDTPSAPPPSKRQRTDGAEPVKKISLNKPPLYPAAGMAATIRKQQHDNSWRLPGVTQFKMQNPEIPQPRAAPIPAYRSGVISPAGDMVPVN